jgi:D-alanyl-lipoteichoic acid acyltransferase DltB (MBOAT superfamily)
VCKEDTDRGPADNSCTDFLQCHGEWQFFEAWGAVFAYTFAYYFDFSGYIDMALGLGMFFNIRLPENSPAGTG